MLLLHVQYILLQLKKCDHNDVSKLILGMYS